MPGIEEILAASQKPAGQEEENYFFPKDAGLLWQGLGLLDLVVGAPARTVQGAAISALAGDNVLEGAGKGFLGLGLDTGEFGQGKVASGIRLLEEMGLVEDRENGWNIAAGIGTDIATDLVTWNVLGAAKRAVFGTSKYRNLTRGGTRVRPFGKSYHRANRIESREISRALLPKLAKSQLRKLADEAGSEAEAFLTKKGTLRKKLMRPGSLKAGPEEYLGQMDFDIIYRGDYDKLKAWLETPRLEELGRAAGVGVGKDVPATFGEFILKNPDDFDVVDVRYTGKRGKYLGANRPGSSYDIRFPDYPKALLEGLPPANEWGKFPFKIPGKKKATELSEGVRISFKGRPAGARWANFLPAGWNPFDFTALLRQWGGVGLLFRGHNKIVEQRAAIVNDLMKISKEAGVSIGDKASMERIFKAGFYGGRGDMSYFDALSTGEKKVAKFFRDTEDSLADTIITDPLTGKTRIALPEDRRLANYGGPQMRLDVPEKAFQDFILVMNEGRKGKTTLNLLGDVPQGTKMGYWKPRYAEKSIEYYEQDAFKAFLAYVNGALRKIHLEPELQMLAPEMAVLNRKFSANTYNLAKRAISNFVGGLNELDGYFDEFVRSVPGGDAIAKSHGALFTKWANIGVAATSRAMIGANPRTPLLQIFQGVYNNTMQVGFWDTFRGFFQAFRGVPAQEALRVKAPQMFNEFLHWMDEYIGRHATKWPKFDQFVRGFDRALFSGISGFDNFNRGWAGMAAYNLALRNGLSEHAALLHAVKSANVTQFLYGKLGASPFRNSPMGRILFQFQSYAMKQLDFMATRMTADPGATLFRYMAAVGFMTRNIGKHIDISTELTPMSPGDAADLLTMKRIPVLSGLKALFDLGKAHTQQALGIPSETDPRFTIEQAGRAFLTHFIPGGSLIGRSYKYMPAATGGLVEGGKNVLGVPTGGETMEVDAYGRKVRDLTQNEAILGLIGFKTTESKLEREAVEDVLFATDFVNNRRSYMMTQALRAVQNGRSPSPWIAEVQRLTKESRARIMQSLRERVKNSQMGLLERRIKQSPKAVRGELKEKYSK